MKDPIHDLVHDHGAINRRVLALGTSIRSLSASGGTGDASALSTELRELREQLFLHFAREEEGLFPFIDEHVPSYGERTQVMAIAHDTICGALARMVHVASAGASIAQLAQLFDRFENAYAAHAQTEAELLEELGDQLDADQRTRLAELVEGL